MRILAIKRKERFSPNHIGNDAAIFEAVCSNLIFKGARIEFCEEESFLEGRDVEQDFIITMARTKSLLCALQRLEGMGKTVLNSAFGIERCFRKEMTLSLVKENIPYPTSMIVDINSDIQGAFAKLGSKGVWIKRGDFHAIHKEDVSFAASAEEAQSILQEYHLRGIKEAVMSEHLTGDLLKFYAVRGTDFFFSFYPYEENHHKYAIYEQINGATLHYPFNMDSLRQTADRAASVLGVDIYGGDAIIGPDGQFHIIDLNDWPSFAPCKAQAAQAISTFLYERFSKKDITKNIHK